MLIKWIGNGWTGSTEVPVARAGIDIAHQTFFSSIGNNKTPYDSGMGAPIGTTLQPPRHNYSVLMTSMGERQCKF